MKEMRFLIIQTSFIGDVILSTALVESIKESQPNAEIDFLLRKGNEIILKNNPHIREVLIWDKGEKKYSNLMRLMKVIRKKKYTHVINLQRFGATGLLTALSGAKEKWGFAKNPFSFSYSKSFPHKIGDGTHEIERNLSVISPLGEVKKQRPAVYPSEKDFEKIKAYQKRPYVCIAPTSVWFTKQVPEEKWLKLIKTTPDGIDIILLGAPADKAACEQLSQKAERGNIINLAGELNLLQSAALMKDAKMNYVNDSAPMHLASAMNAPTTAYFCSTIPEFGFGPLSESSEIIETKVKLNCRPCGLHGKKTCPEGHFKCALTLEMSSKK